MLKRKETISQDVSLRSAKYIADNGGDHTTVFFGVDVTLTNDKSEFNLWNVDGVSKPINVASLDSLEDATTWYNNLKEEELQNSKPTDQKTTENNFFTLTEQILTTASDPRAGQTPPVKLTFTEINTVIKTIQAVDAMTAVNFSLELLAIDAELKRFNTLWWDTASTHE